MGDIGKENELLGQFGNLNEAVFFALDVLHTKFKNGYPLKGAGAPPNKIIGEWVEKHGSNNKGKRT